MIYCMADIHGEVDRYHQMLEVINFSDNDTLYIIGDVIDRFPGGIELLKEIMDKSNIKLILGNHEHMMLDVLGPYSLYCSKSMWLANGGEHTYNEWVYMTDPQVKDQILKYLLAVPDHLDIEVNGRKFHLVHGCPGDNTNNRVWERPLNLGKAPFDDRMVILGHTPTCHLIDDFVSEARIIHGPGYIDIDCGCGHKIPGKKLACLRLDDMAEFYV